MNDLIKLIHGYDIYYNFDYKKYAYRPIGWNINDKLFQMLIQQTNPKIILEFGSWYGASAISMGKIIKDNQLDTKIICIDSWLGSEEFIGLHDRDNDRQLLSTFGYPNAYYQFLANICHAELQNIVIPFPQSTHNAARWLKHQKITADLVYIDGSNETLDMYHDMVYGWNLLKNNGIIFGDDFNNPNWRSINAGLNKFCNTHRVEPIILPEFPNHWTIKKNNDNFYSTKLILITCTYDHTNRKTYIKYLIQNVINHLNNYIWILVEDNNQIDKELLKILQDSGVNFEYLFYGPTRKGGNAQRNFALEYIYDFNIDGIIYSLDDDNIYNIKLFDEIRKTKNISIFPVGGWGRPLDNPERPLLDENHKFIKWNSTWQRKYSTDMAGFAFNSQLLQNIKKPFWTYIEHGGGESEFIDRLVKSTDDIEFNLCNYNTDCYVYHNALRDIQYPTTESWPIYRTQNPIYKTKYGHSDDTENTKNIISNILEKYRIQNITEKVHTDLIDIYSHTIGSFGGPDKIEAVSIIYNLLSIKEPCSIVELGCWKGRVSSIIHKFKPNLDIDIFHIDNFHSDDGLNKCLTKQDNIRLSFIKTMEEFNIDKYFLIEQNFQDIQWCMLINKPIAYIYYDLDMDVSDGIKGLCELIPFMHKICRIEFHDSSWPKIAAIVEYLCNNHNFSKLYKIDIWEGSVVIEKTI